MVSFPPPIFTARPNLSSRLSPSQINRHLAPPPQTRPPPPTPPPPDPPTVPILSPIPPPCNPSSADGPPTKKWSSLFESKPRNAGSFSPPPMKLIFKGKAMQPTDQIFAAAKEQWSGYLIGHFLDRPLPYSVVSSRLKKLWNPSGGVKIKSTGTVFFFYFDRIEDREKILQSDPMLIHNKIFIVRPWATSLGDLNKSIGSVPVWIKLSNLPLYCLSKVGICWLAMRIGKFLCMDLSTEKMERLEYAKCMVEITPHDELPYEFPVLLPDGSEQIVHVSYLWRPAICVKCDSFGHTSFNCAKQKEELPKESTKSVKIRAPANKIGVSEQSNSNVTNGVSLAHTGSSWRMVTGKGINGTRNNTKSTLAKGKEKADEGDTRGNKFTVLSSLHEEEIVNVDEDECEEGEIRQVSELLSRAFPPFVSSAIGAASLQQACSSSMAHTGDQSGLRLVVELKSGKGNFDNLNGITETAFSRPNVDENNFGLDNEYDETTNEIGHNEVNKYSVVESINSDTSKLDSFLQSHFDCVEVSDNQVKNKNQTNTNVKERFRDYEKGVRETIESLRTEIDSGLFDPSVSFEKKKLMDTMINNYNNMEMYATERKKFGLFQTVKSNSKTSPSALKPGFLNVCKNKVSSTQESTQEVGISNLKCNVIPTTPITSSKEKEITKRKPGPYDHIKPPPGYKAPPDPIINTPIAVSTSGRSLGSAPITRSKKIELLKGFDDDMG